MGHSKLVTSTLSAAISLVMATGSRAAGPASDNAADPSYSAGWATGTDGGTGFGAWTLAPVATPPQFSYFIGSSASNGAAPPSGSIDSAGKSWGLANAIADACRASRQ